jgi:hypothetical protein
MTQQLLRHSPPTVSGKVWNSHNKSRFVKKIW